MQVFQVKPAFKKHGQTLIFLYQFKIFHQESRAKAVVKNTISGEGRWNKSRNSFSRLSFSLVSWANNPLLFYREWNLRRSLSSKWKEKHFWGRFDSERHFQECSINKFCFRALFVAIVCTTRVWFKSMYAAKTHSCRSEWVSALSVCIAFSFSEGVAPLRPLCQNDQRFFHSKLMRQQNLSNCTLLKSTPARLIYFFAVAQLFPYTSNDV